MSPRFKVLVCGGRDYAKRDTVFLVLDTLAAETPGGLHIIHGNAEGADSLAQEWAAARCVPWTVYPANWQAHGKKAGPMRNQQMLAESKPDLVVAFPGGRGTADMVSRANGAHVRIQDWR